ncbi:MAG TPA: response regulator [Opitutus sp.]|nr:response regulator [Opitutus sp.]
MKILAVEDDPTAGLMIEATLKSLGHDVILVDSATAGLDVLKREPIRAVVSDWQLGDTDGLDLCRMVRVRPGDYVYFILLTQQEGTEENERLAMEAGVDDFLSKPVSVHDMRLRLHVAERILAYTQQVQQLESLIPICGYCKKVRDDQNFWQQVETYIGKRTGSRFSHGICPDCYAKIAVPALKELGVEVPSGSPPAGARRKPTAGPVA